MSGVFAAVYSPGSFKEAHGWKMSGDESATTCSIKGEEAEDKMNFSTSLVKKPRTLCHLVIFDGHTGRKK
jgi:hypothetical protein